MSDASDVTPAGWKLAQLSCLAKVVSGGTPSRDVSSYWGGDIPWVTPTDITRTNGRYLLETQENISRLGLSSSSATLLPPSSILMTSRATVGESRIAGMEVCTNQGFKSLIPQKGVNGLFLYYQMQRLRGAYKVFGIGSTFLEVSKKDTERFSVLIPENEGEQKAIAAVINSVDVAIEKTEALIAKYQQIKAGLMHDLFTRGVTADGKLRPPREQAPELYQETPIGWIPKEWDVNTLRSCIVGNPTNGIYKPPTLIGYGTLLVGQTAFTRERSIDFAFARRAVLNEDELTHYGLMENDILITRVFATVDGVGQPTLVPVMNEPAVYESNMMRLRLERTVILPVLLFEWMRSHPIRRMVVLGANASNQTSINQQVLNLLPVPRPLPEEQHRMVKIIKTFDKRIMDEKSLLENLCQQKSGLMHDLLTGLVQVKVL